MRNLLLVTTAAIALALSVFAVWIYDGGGSHRADAATKPINCSYVLDPSTSPPTETVTCVGDIFIITPFGTKEIKFTLVIDANDNGTPGPSFGDQVTACTIAFNGGSPYPIHVGPCP